MTDLTKWKKKLLEIVSKIDDDEFEGVSDLVEELEKLLDEIFDAEEEAENVDD